MGLVTRFTVAKNQLLARLSFGPKRVKLQHLIPELKLVMEQGVAKIGPYEYAPNHFILYMSESDLVHHAPLLPALRDAVIAELGARAEQNEWRLLADSVSLDILPYGELEQGEFDLDARIIEAADAHALPIEAPSTPTPPAAQETVVAPEGTAPSARQGAAPATVLSNKSRDPAGTVLMTKSGRKLAEKEEALTDVATAVFKVVRGGDPGRIVTMSGTSAVFGRDDAADITLGGDDRLSRRHFEVSVQDGRLVVEDLRSGNGTRVGGKLLERAFLKQGSRIQAGETVLEVVIAPGLS